MPIITTLNVPLGGSTHMVVEDQDGNKILPSQVEWSGDMAGVVARIADNTGFVFHGIKTGSVILTYDLKGTSPLISNTLTVSVTTTVTALQAESP